MVTIKSEREIKLMREACKVVAQVYDKLEKVIKPGMTTYELDQIAENEMRKLGAIPAEKGYNPGIKGVPPYPATLCVSINDEVIHGVPSKYKVIKEGTSAQATLPIINKSKWENLTLFVPDIDEQQHKFVPITL